MTGLAQIVPELPPAIGGIASFSAALARALAERHGLPSFFLVAADSWHATDGLAGEAIGERNAENLGRRLTASGADSLLIHYANYAYQPRGCPFWLVAGVLRWRAASPRRRLVTVFHEVYASGAPWHSSFWLSPVQRRLAARLLRASDGAATSLPLYGRMLARWGPRGEVVVAPVLSPVGEPATVPAPAERRPRIMLVFGGPGQRGRAFGELRETLAAACRALDIDEIVDLGPPLPALPERVDGVPVRALGLRPAGEVSAQLLASYAGFIAYPAPFLAKSTVFAAYCAHGLVPVCAWPRRRSESGERLPFWEPGGEPLPGDPADLAARARDWYRGHDLAHQAASFLALLGAGREGRPG